MDVFLRVADMASGDGSPATDVVVQVEPSHTVAELTQALRRWFDRGHEQCGPADADAGRHRHDVVRPIHGDVSDRMVAHLIRSSTGEVLSAQRQLGALGLMSGEHLRLTARRSDSPRCHHEHASGSDPRFRHHVAVGDEASSLVVTSGLDVGRRVELGVSPVTIGRDRTCDLVLTDPTVSRVHLVVEATMPGENAAGVTVSQADEARSPVTLNGQPFSVATRVLAGDVVRIGATTLSLAGVGGAVAAAGADQLGQLAFHRTPYYPAPVQQQVFEPIGEIPERPEPPRFAYLSALAPLALGVTLAVFYSPRMLLFAVFSPVIAVAAYAEARRRNSRRFGQGHERYQRRLAERRLELADALATERSRRFRSAPDLSTLATRARHRSVELWVRDRGAPDFLQVRLGLGNVEAAVKIKPETAGDEVLRDELEQEMAVLATIIDVPISIDLTADTVVGLVGTLRDTSDLAASLVVQTACLHSPEDVVFLAAVSPRRAMNKWLKWFPHVRAASSPLGGEHLATTREGADRLLRKLLAVAESRVADGDKTIDRRWPWLVVLIDRLVEPEASLVSRLLDLSSRAGISVLWLTDGRDRVPRQATAALLCDSLLAERPSTLTRTDPAIGDLAVEIDRASVNLAMEIATSLAPVRDASSVTAAAALPRVATLHHALGVDHVDADWIVSQWRQERGHALITPVGAALGGPFVIDLVAHGPHGLIGGTSGSGKSELLMAMVAGLIAFNPPTKLNLLFVDYKGGASSGVFRQAPHTVGYVTNLDALLARRALTSLRAELNRRMNLLEGRAKDLAEMIDRHPEEAPPSLVIIVDEFATLVKEVPEFVAGIVDIAQRGRSLGIHLLLATQRPSGAVNDNILANTNLRISLRMLDGSESTSVIGTTDAATIPTPLKGRAYARVGPGELVAFQSAWTGAAQLSATGPPPVTVDLFDTEVNRASRPVKEVNPAEAEAASLGGGSAESQLDGLLDAVLNASSSLGLGSGPSPWQEELPAILELSDLPSSDTPRPLAPSPSGWPVPIGLIDSPENQAHYRADVDFEASGGLAVFGTGGCGKTTTLRTVAISAAIDDAENGGGNLTIFGLDFASRELVAISRLPQCAAVAAGDDLEAVTRIVAVLQQLVERRRSVLAAAAANGEDAPTFSRVLLLIDDYGNLAQSFEGAGASTTLFGWLETLNRIVVDGRQVGVHSALSASRRAVVKATVLSAITNRVVLRQADVGGYSELGLPSAMTADLELGPGRGFFGGTSVLQVATSASVEFDRVTAGSPDPELVTSALPVDVALFEPMEQGAVVPIGLTDLSAEPALVDLSVNNLTIVGDPRSGRSNALAVLGRNLVAAGQEVWAVGPATSPLADLDCLGQKAFGSPADIASLLERLPPRLEGVERQHVPVVLLDDVDLLDTPALDALMAKLCSLGWRWVAATIDLRGYSTSQLVQDMKKARSFLHLRPAGARDVQELTGSVAQLRPGLAMPPGRGVLVQHRQPAVVQISRWDSSLDFKSTRGRTVETERQDQLARP